jgi:hypothetical protein
MTTNKNITLVFERPHPAGLGGVQKVYKCANGYGASVIRFMYSYGGDEGLWEMAVIRFLDEEHYEIDYATPITNDVLGSLSDEDVKEKLNAISELPPFEVQE